ncbi:MAG: hypothetical protein IKW74_08455, partial [Thermoguttaceae bacterium]|nr:hypothetical protein [Thermoguttaceae bacterium]
MEKQLRETAKKLLQEGTVQVVIGYGRVETGGIGAIFVTNPDNADNLVWNQECSQNLVTYLTRKEIRKLGKAAIVVKACDARAVVVLKNESQLENNDVVVIGVACPGILNHRGSGDPVLQARCETCTERLPKNVDFVIGDESVNLPPLSVEQRSR